MNEPVYKRQYVEKSIIVISDDLFYEYVTGLIFWKYYFQLVAEDEGYIYGGGRGLPRTLHAKFRVIHYHRC